MLTTIANLLAFVAALFRSVRRRMLGMRDGYVLLTIDGPVRELEPRRSWLMRRLTGTEDTPSVEWVRALCLAIARDPGAAGLLVRMRSLEAGLGTQSSLREALVELRASGKDVVAYLPDGADTATMFVASAARKVLVGTATMVAPVGYAATGRYLRRALDRLGIEAEVHTKGAYKSAGDRLVRDMMSPADREQVEALLDDRHAALVAALAQGRRVDPARAARWIDDAPHAAVDAVALGIVDAVAEEEEVEEHLEPGLGALRVVGARAYWAVSAPVATPGWGRARSIGLIPIHGLIATGRSGGASEAPLIAAIRRARVDPRVAAVVLHIDSRGGSALGSRRIHHEVRRLAEIKPVVACLGDVAASGGYYVAAAAHAIVAQPLTVTGSIGVVSTRLVLDPLLSRLGVSTEVIKRGARADLYVRSRRLEPSDHAAIDRELSAVYRTFIEDVAKGRGREVSDIAPIAEGRVYSGGHARALGLIDELGGLERAVHEARSWLGDDGRRLGTRLIRPELRAPWRSRAGAIAMRLAGLGRLGDALALGRSLGRERVLVYCAADQL